MSSAASARTIVVAPALAGDELRSIPGANVVKSGQGDVDALGNFLGSIAKATPVFTFNVGDQRGRANGLVIRYARTAATGTVFV